MKCEECGSRDNEFDERMGEKVCSNCGLVLVAGLFEETVHILDRAGNRIHSADNGKLGSVITGKGSTKFNRRTVNVSNVPKHITTGLVHCNMVMSNITSSQSVKERVEKVYKELHAGLKGFKKTTYENRATAVVYYVLKELRRPAPLKEVCAEFEVEPRIIKRYIRKINHFYGNKVNYQPVSPEYYLNQLLPKITNDLSYHNDCLQVLNKFEAIVQEAQITTSKSYYASICWITSNMFLKGIKRSLISEKSGYAESCIYQQTKVLLRLVGISSVKDIQGKQIEKIGEKQ
jgi:transcription initiation factor TFIIIB Brf1 subunit/transcription initiation factor TFIIB